MIVESLTKQMTATTVAVRELSCTLRSRTSRYSVPTDAHQCILDTAPASTKAEIVRFHQVPPDSDCKIKNIAKATVLATTAIIAAPTM